MNRNLTEVDKARYTHTAAGLFITGAIIFVIGSSLLFIVSKNDLNTVSRKVSGGLFY